PMDIVKIDKSFVDRITGGNEGLKIVKTMVDLGASLDLTTLAEGVEEEDQLEALNSLGCTTYQGYFFAKPMPIDEFVTVLESQRKNAVSAMSASTN
ncbi:MAG TPA: EAL domain-containing protein, partial [Acidimicrobiales bacterium]|nr:EAL domain-containing protein [Acidimicrobiales bacterium]